MSLALILAQGIGQLLAAVARAKGNAGMANVIASTEALATSTLSAVEAHLAAHPEEVELAIWFHDAVYDATRSDNEQKSAEWAQAVIHESGLSSGLAERVASSILATRHHGEVTDPDAQLLVDIDLSILGRDPDIFWQYEENIRKEYSWVPQTLFQQERLKILQSFLDRPHIYYHGEYREKFEARARANLEQAIARLGS